MLSPSGHDFVLSEAAYSHKTCTINSNRRCVYALANIFHRRERLMESSARWCVRSRNENISRLLIQTIELFYSNLRMHNQLLTSPEVLIMKKMIVLSIASAILVSSLIVPSESGECRPGLWNIGGRQQRQQNRIANGVSSGSLNSTQTSRLQGRESRLSNQVSRMRTRDGGSLNPGQRVRIEQKQNSISRGIYRQKH
jgi:hypothetical protein